MLDPAAVEDPGNGGMTGHSGGAFRGGVSRTAADDEAEDVVVGAPAGWINLKGAGHEIAVSYGGGGGSDPERVGSAGRAGLAAPTGSVGGTLGDC